MPPGKGYEDAGNAIRTRFKADWIVLGPVPRTPIAYDNGRYEPVDGTAWVRLSILDGDAEQADLAPSPRMRHVGLVVVGIFVPSGKLDGAARALGDAAAAIFRRLVLPTAAGDKILFRAPAYRVIGTEPPWHQASVTTAFYRDSIF